MKIARIIFPVNVLGRGNRVVIWTVGCTHRCKGCSNPELWDDSNAKNIDVSEIIKVVRTFNVDGITITGGEPFMQPEELHNLIQELSIITDDILVYSGYRLNELKAMNNRHVNAVLNLIAVLIDGRYIEDRNKGQKLRGSDNQKIHILNPALKDDYEQYLNTLPLASQVQNFLSSGSVISVGIHKPNFESDFDERMKNKGLGELKGDQ